MESGKRAVASLALLGWKLLRGESFFFVTLFHVALPHEEAASANPGKTLPFIATQGRERRCGQGGRAGLAFEWMGLFKRQKSRFFVRPLWNHKERMSLDVHRWGGEARPRERVSTNLRPGV